MKKLLVLNDFLIHTLEHGGMIRIFNIYSRLSIWYDITYLCFTRNNFESIHEFNPHFREIAIPLNFFQRIAIDLVRYITHLSCDDSLTLYTGITNQRMRELIQERIKNSDAVILVHPYMFPFVKNFPNTNVLIHDSLNVEYLLKKSFYPPGWISSFLLSNIKRSEKDLIHRSTLCFSVSEEDRNELASLYCFDPAKFSTIPNGVDVDQYSKNCTAKSLINRPLVIFLGSGHPPNVTAASQIITNIAPQLPSVFFLICGSVCNALRDVPIGKNVGLAFFVTDEEKIELFLSADIAINPMISGSGTNVKMFDYMAAGLPVVTTPIGARGLPLVDRETAIICEIDKFSDEILFLIKNPMISAKVAQMGRDLVRKNYSWSTLSKKMYRSIHECIGV